METEKYTDIHVRCDNRVARISINRPEKLNALRIQTYHELVTALKIADESPDCHIILLESDNGHFSSGNDFRNIWKHTGYNLCGNQQGRLIIIPPLCPYSCLPTYRHPPTTVHHNLT